jgi:hypothetical protein
MDYVMITAIMTFFILLFFLKKREGYTDNYINGAIESLKKTNANIDKTIININDLKGTNINKPLKIDVLDALEQINECVKTKPNLNPETITALDKQKDMLVTVQDNVIKINKKLKEVLDTVYVSIIRMNDTKPVTVPLIVALNFLSEDITGINDKLQTIPDK